MKSHRHERAKRQHIEPESAGEFLFETSPDAAMVNEDEALKGAMNALPTDIRAKFAMTWHLRDYRTLAADYRDELLPDHSAMLSLGVPEAHDRTRSAGVSIAAIDTGVGLSHPDLVARDPEYRDFVQMDDSPDAEQHGTAIAALIRADASNGVGMIGFAPAANTPPPRRSLR